MAKTAITPTRQENYPEWYQQVVRAADMAESSPVRGCMVIKPWGYALWENIQRTLDDMFKATGHRNAYFPLFIPKSFLEKEAEHVEGFAKECAVVTHHRLIEGADGGLIPDPDAKLDEPLIVRPTSEMIIGDAFSRWVESYRDLPLLINQWANVVRWELRTRLFLRTSEFLWQEGHTAHATKEEAVEETLKMLDVYVDFAENWMALPVIKGKKSEGEKFPGAVDTYTFEPMMQDRKALQAGTSHFLGQNFAKAQDIEFLDADGERKHAWTTSWGVSTRLIGGLIMAHADDDGLVLPPKLAPAHVVILPITFKADDPQKVIDYCNNLATELRQLYYHGRRIEVEVDTRDLRGGDKNWEWVKKGVPIRLEVGPRDMADDAVFMARRDKSPKEKQSVPRQQFVEQLTQYLDEMQQALFDRAKAHRDEHMRGFKDREKFYKFFTPKNKEQPEIHGGFALAHWCGDEDVAAKVQKDLGVTIRCIPFTDPLGEEGEGRCIFTGKPSPKRVVWAKSY
ncbi:proline--tRNA ligase [Phycisphaerales bacterium AB-hyl4]|uniref:Proline--tRNA ligase n=1 Tax=Natronomicrosphaera hydrolytica TaxID=3242702 RepID=A0ABV4U3G6_9BACT